MKLIEKAPEQIELDLDVLDLKEDDILATESSDQSTDLDLVRFDLQAEEKIEQISAPSYLRADKIYERGFD